MSTAAGETRGAPGRGVAGVAGAMGATRAMGGAGRLRRWLLAAAAAVVLPAAAGAQETLCDPGDVEVRRLAFSGNETFESDELAQGLVITPSSWLRRALGVVGARRCISRDELARDVARLTVYYRRRGFYQAAVDTTVTPVAEDAVAVEFRITEGPSLRRDTLRATLGLVEGMRFDQYALDSARVSLTRRLRNSGYPLADVLLGYETNLPRQSATVTLDALPGPRARIGEIDLRVTPRDSTTQQIADPIVRGVLGIREGALYREGDLLRAQRNLYQTDAYSHVAISLDSLTDAERLADSATVTVVVAARETFLRTASTGVGWGSLDCFRLSGDYTNVNFLRTARRLELSARVSKIGVGDPLDVAPGLCVPDVREDLFSEKLNYFAGATIRAPLLFGRTFPTVSLYSERRSEFKAFLRTTPVALGLSRSWPRGLGVPVTLTYNLEYGRTEAQPALFCAAFNLCEEEDRRRVEEFRRLAVLGASVVRDRSDDPVEPTTGSILRLDYRHASRIVGSDPLQQFNQVVGNASWYQAVSRNTTLAARLRMGAVLGSSFAASGTERFVPPQERLYAGGPGTVRGFRQNELGPVVYIALGYTPVDSVVNGETQTYYRIAGAGYDRVVPVGGNWVVVANFEARQRSPVWADLLQFTAFVDGGIVSPELDQGLRGMRWTPGLGVRLASPVGPLRMDIGYNPYALSTGAAYFDAPIAGGVAPLYCVSPGNTFPVRAVGSVPVQDTSGDECPATFQPRRGGSFFHRLTFNFSIGQAF